MQTCAFFYKATQAISVCSFVTVGTELHASPPCMRKIRIVSELHLFWGRKTLLNCYACPLPKFIEVGFFVVMVVRGSKRVKPRVKSSHIFELVEAGRVV